MKRSLMSRRAVWLQLVLGWLPLWALFTVLIYFVHSGVSAHAALFISLRSIIGAVILGFAVQRFTEKFPWPSAVHIQFVLLHIGAALAYAFGWFVLNSIIESLLHLQLVIVLGVGVGPFLLVGMWLYVMIAGVSYTLQSNERAAVAEAEAAQAQLSALRGQINPHFLFNALHTVVQLIPQDPKSAAHAAQQVAALLRTTLEEDRDVVSLDREIDFVKRYLDVELIRFGDRLRVTIDVPPETLTTTLPSFAVQTLVENAVRHGAQPQVEPTDLTITARNSSNTLHVAVSDTGAGYNPGAAHTGTGLRRLRARLSALYGSSALVEVKKGVHNGTLCELQIPQGDND